MKREPKLASVLTQSDLRSLEKIRRAVIETEESRAGKPIDPKAETRIIRK